MSVSIPRPLGAGEAPAAPAPAAAASSVLARMRADAGFQAFLMLRLGFAVLPILFGADKFSNLMVDWPQYLAPWIHDLLPGTAQQIMHGVGVVEIIAGVVVALKPRYGAILVAGWLGGIVIDLLSYSGYYDVAVRDFGLMLGALTLARLAWRYDPPLQLRRSES